MTVKDAKYDYCPNYTAWLIGQDDNQAYITRARCGMWICPYCGPKNRSVWRAHLIDSIRKLGCQHWSFLTVTAHENARTIETSKKNLQSGSSKLIKRIRRIKAKQQDGESLEYVRVYEPHKDKAMHLHYIVNLKTYANADSKPKGKKKHTKLCVRMIKDTSRSCGMGYQADAKNIDGHAGYVAAYITKYMTKGLDDLPKGTRRIQCSSGLSLRASQEQSQIDWYAQSDFREMDAVMLWSHHRDIIDLDYDVTIEALHFGRYGQYINE